MPNPKISIAESAIQATCGAAYDGFNASSKTINAGTTIWRSLCDLSFPSVAFLSCALAALRGSCGDTEMLRRLRTAVYMVFLPSDQCEAPDTQIAPCVEAERALDRYAACRDVGDEDSLVLEHILTLQDDYFTTLQRYRLSELWQHVSAFATSDVPLPVAAVLGKLRVGGRLNAAA